MQEKLENKFVGFLEELKPKKNCFWDQLTFSKKYLITKMSFFIAIKFPNVSSKYFLKGILSLKKVFWAYR